MKSLQKEQNSTNLLLWPPICRNKPAITPKWFNSLETNYNAPMFSWDNSLILCLKWKNSPPKKKFTQLCLFSPIPCFMGSKLREKSRIKTQSTPIIFASRTRLSSMMLWYGLEQLLKNHLIGSPYIFTNFFNQFFNQFSMNLIILSTKSYLFTLWGFSMR